MYEFEARTLWDAATNWRDASAAGRAGDAVFHVGEIEALAMHSERRAIRARALRELARIADAPGPRKVAAAAREALRLLAAG